MKPAKCLVYLAALSIILGLVAKVFGIDFTSLNLTSTFPIRPLSFLQFANTLLLLSIALSLLDRQE